MIILQAIRSVFSVLVGYLLFAISTFMVFKLFEQPSHQAAPVWFMIFVAVIGMSFSLLGGYLSGLLAGRSPFGHAIAVAALIVSGASFSLLATIGKGAIWSQLVAIILIAPCAIAGGWLRRRQSRQGVKA